jgi:hypothetical protein
MIENRITALRHSAFYSPLLATIAGGFLPEEGLEPVYRPALLDAMRKKRNLNDYSGEGVSEEETESCVPPRHCLKM